jgi:hypothetical protein
MKRINANRRKLGHAPKLPVLMRESRKRKSKWRTTRQRDSRGEKEKSSVTKLDPEETQLKTKNRNEEHLRCEEDTKEK